MAMVAGTAGRAGATRAAAGSRAGGRRMSVGGKRVTDSYANDDDAGAIVTRASPGSPKPGKGGRPTWATDEAIAAESADYESSSMSERNKLEGGTHKPGKDPFAPGGTAARPGTPARGGRSGTGEGRYRVSTRARHFGKAAMGQPRAGSDLGGAVVAVFVWAWVILPALRDGPDGVRNVLRAKFFNKGPDGQWLP